MKKTITAAVGLGALAVAYWLLSPLFIDKEVHEELPEEIAAVVEMFSEQVDEAMEDAFEDAMGVMAMKEIQTIEEVPVTSNSSAFISSGTFEDVAHHGSGNVQLLHIRKTDQSIVRIENLDVLNGPDLRVLLSKNKDIRSHKDLGEYIELGRLKGNKGNQNYAFTLDADTNLSEYQSVIIYCKPFKVVFASANLSPVVDTLVGEDIVSEGVEFDSDDLGPPAPEELVGSWRVIKAQTVGWETITLDASGEYYSHLHDRPFDAGDWTYKRYKSGTLTIASEAGPKMSHTFNNVTLDGDRLRLNDKGIPTVWDRVK